MPLFVVERYLPGLTADEVSAQAALERDAISAAASTEGAGKVRLVRTTYLLDDELCFSLFEAPSREALSRANMRAALPYERIVEAIDALGTSTGQAIGQRS